MYSIDCNLGRYQSPFGSLIGSGLRVALGYSSCDLNCYGDLLLWIKAHCLELSDGDPVPSMANYATGSPMSVAQSNASFRPTFQTNEVNGLPCVEFNGTDQRFNVTGNLNTSDYTLIIVMKALSSSGFQSIYEMYVDPLGTPSGFNFYSITGTPTMYHSDGTSGQVQVISSGGFGSNWLVMTFQSEDQDTHRRYVNGNLATSSSITGALDPTGVNSGVIGAHFNGLGISDFFRGQIAEMALYSEVLSGANRLEAELCLMNKYGIERP
jgi:hypothetical protein